MLVFNYGSNLSKKQFRLRCPTARLIGQARIPGYRLTFSGYSFGRDGSVATIMPEKGAVVYGAVYELRSPEDVRALDAAEGFPVSYGCEEISARVNYKGVWCKRKVWAYIKADKREAQPSTDYLKVVAQGYKDHGLDIARLTKVLSGLPFRSNKPKPAVKRPTYSGSQRSFGPPGKSWDWNSGWTTDAPSTPNPVKDK